MHRWRDQPLLLATHTEVLHLFDRDLMAKEGILVPPAWWLANVL